jgi:hypothetical protein
MPVGFKEPFPAAKLERWAAYVHNVTDAWQDLYDATETQRREADEAEAHHGRRHF